MRISRFDLGWMVGIFDGEGSVSTRTNGKTDKHYGYVEVSMTDLDTIERLASLWGEAANITTYQRKHKYKRTLHQRMYRVRVTKREEAQRIVMEMYPHLCQRRQGQVDDWMVKTGW